MRDWIKRIRRLGTDDAVNKDAINSVVQQLQHNIELLYSSQSNTRQDKNLTELLYGNLMDYDQIGFKRFVNGGTMDTIEKVLSFDVASGTTELEEVSLYNGEYFLTWFLDEGINANIKAIRNIKVTDSLLGQKLLIGFKAIGFSNGSALDGERFDIYVNNTYCGSNDSKLVVKNNIPVFGTIYGTYDLSSEETNLKVEFRRSSTNANTPENYVIRIQNVFVGLNTLSNTSYELNYPTEIGFLAGESPDINDFYDFENINAKPIPTFLTSSRSTSGGNDNYTINVTPANDPTNDTFYVGLAQSGDGTGSSPSNRISSANFFLNKHNTPNVKVFIESNTYSNFEFDDGVSYEVELEGDITINGTGLNVKNNSFLQIKTNNELILSNLNVIDSKLSVLTNGTDTNKFATDLLTVKNGQAFFDVVNFSMPVSSGGEVVVEDHSNVIIDIKDTGVTNSDSLYNIGVSFGPTKVINHSNLSVICLNNSLMGHIGYGDGVQQCLQVSNHSSFSNSMEGLFSTSSADKDYVIEGHSSVSINNMQLDGGITAFGEHDLKMFSTLSTTGISDLTGTNVSSYIFEY